MSEIITPHPKSDELVVGCLYSNEDISRKLKVSNAGGIRPCLQDNAVRRIAVMTCPEDFHAMSENPYHDRLEGVIPIYTAAGKSGRQTLAGINNRLIAQKQLSFPIHGFIQIASRRDKSIGPRRWGYLRLLHICAIIRTHSSIPMERSDRCGCLNSEFMLNLESCRSRWI